MQKLIELKKEDNVLVSSKVENFLKPDAVYLPIFNNKILVNQNDKVKIGDEVIEGVLAPISGVVKNLKKFSALNGNIYCLEIINDFEERNRNVIGIKNRLTKEKILKYINLDGKNNLVLNAIDDEVYVLTENFYLALYYEEFLEFLDDISKIINIDNIYVCLKASSSENVNKLMSDLGMYPNIELVIVPDLYLLGKTKFLLKYLNLNANETKVIKAEEFFFLYNYLKRGRTKSEKLITISGNGIKNPIIVQVKIGSLLKDIVKEFIVFKNNDVKFFANGIMGGKEIDLDSFVVTDNLNSLIIMKSEKEKKKSKCINCGLCSDICPVNLNPLLFNNKKYLEKAKKECLNCGLCSYICPVYINFNKYLKGEENA